MNPGSDGGSPSAGSSAPPQGQPAPPAKAAEPPAVLAHAASLGSGVEDGGLAVADGGLEEEDDCPSAEEDCSAAEGHAGSSLEGPAPAAAPVPALVCPPAPKRQGRLPPPPEIPQEVLADLRSPGGEGGAQAEQGPRAPGQPHPALSQAQAWLASIQSGTRTPPS